MTSFHQRLVYGLVLLNTIPHFGDLPTWVPLTALIFVGWRWVADIISIPVPNRWVSAIFAIVCSAGVWGEYGRIIGDEASASLLLLMVALKVFEIRGYRDVMFVTYLTLLLLMTKLLSSQTLGTSIFMVVDVILILSVMQLFHMPNMKREWSWRGAARLVLQAIPLLVILFLIFPRFNFGLFNRTNQTTGRVGFSDTLNPGSISKLIRSSEVAFRAFFYGVDRPMLNRLYWRGAILTKSEGLVWSKESIPGAGFGKVDPPPSRVEIMLEPTDSTWLFTLDWPTSIGLIDDPKALGLQEYSGRTFQSRLPMRSREKYFFTYEPAATNVRWETEDFEKSLVVEGKHAKTAELVKSWKIRHGVSADIINRMKEFFSEENFMYTLTPPANSSLDDFLFVKKLGFCEHYAAASASILRLNGVPARVVVGYQGGVKSLLDDYFIVGQQDAHAWVEYWNERSRGWHRLDPTQWIAPDRLDLGAQGFFEKQSPGEFAAIKYPIISSLFGSSVALWFGRSSLFVDQAEISWINFLLHYDFEFQKNLFKRLGLGDVTRGLLALLTLFAAAFGTWIAYMVLRRRSRRRLPALVVIYRLLCKRLARVGVIRVRGEGPMAFAQRAVLARPDEATELGAIFAEWMAHRYGEKRFSDRDYWLLRHRVRSLNLKNS